MKTYRNCDECGKPKSCNKIALRKILDDKTHTRYYYFYVCDNCLSALSDIGNTQSLVDTVPDV